MVWGCFNFNGCGPLVPITGTMNAAKYRDVLAGYLIPYVTDKYPNGDFIYQQDNAPCHKAVLAKNFLEENEITTIDWPPYSPDLAPIENLWAIVKRKLHGDTVRTRNDLLEKLDQIWKNDEEIKNACNALVESMPRRIQACINSNGGPIKY